MTGIVVDVMFLTLITIIYNGHSGGCNFFYLIAIISDGHSGGCDVFDSNSAYI